MGRMVEGPRKRSDVLHESAGGGGDASTPGDNFLERVVKYVPAEILAFYLTVDRLVFSDADGLRKVLIEKKDTPGFSLVTIAKERNVSLKSLTLDYYLPDLVFLLCLISVFVFFWSYATFSNEDKSARIPWKKQAFVSAFVFAVWAYAMHGGMYEMHDLFLPKLAALLVPFVTLLSGAIPPTTSKRDEQAISDIKKSVPAREQPVVAVSQPQQAAAALPREAVVVTGGSVKRRL